MLRTGRVLRNALKMRRSAASSKTSSSLRKSFSSVTEFKSGDDVLSKLKEDFPQDSAIKIESTGRKDEYNVTTVECKNKLEELQLEGENQVNLFMSKEEEEKGSLLDAVGLGPWHRKASIGFMFGVTALSKEMYILNEETYVAMCLSGFGLLLYLNARKPFMDWFNSEKDAILKAQNDAEDKHMAACQTFLDSQTGSEALFAELEALSNEKRELIELESKANAVKERNAVQAEYERRLVSIVNKKADEQNQLYKQLVADARAYAQSAVHEDAFKKDALKFAITAIANPDKAGDNPTAGVFEKFLKQK